MQCSTNSKWEMFAEALNCCNTEQKAGVGEVLCSVRQDFYH